MKDLTDIGLLKFEVKELKQQIQEQQQVIDKLEKVRVFYGDKMNWSEYMARWYGGKLAREVGENKLVKKYTGGVG